MQNRWNEHESPQAVDRWGPEYGESFALRLYTARLIGADPYLALHGGGNVSVKGAYRNLLGDEIDAIYVKASGRDLATLEPAGLPGLDLTYLRRLRVIDSLTDAALADQFRTHLLCGTGHWPVASATRSGTGFQPVESQQGRVHLDAPSAGASRCTLLPPMPSIETLVHAFLPHRFVDHSHADAILILTNQSEGASLIREALGERVAVVPYEHPGLELARAVATVHEENPKVEGLVLLHHGLITFGDDARTSYERHIDIVSACESFTRQRCGTGFQPALSPGSKPVPQVERLAEPAELAARVAPMLRGLLAAPTGDEDRPHRRMILEWRASDEILSFVNSDDGQRLAETGALTGDHLIRTKPRPMFVAKPAWSDANALRNQLDQAVSGFKRDYEAYVNKHGKHVDLGEVDALPRVVLLPGCGVLCWGWTKRDARIAADITEHTLAAQLKAEAIGSYLALPDSGLFAMEYRALQRAKIADRDERPLAGQVVVISGGGGAIGSGIARVCSEAGALVAVTDLNPKRLDKVVQRVESVCGADTATGVVMDVTDEDSVRRGFEDICRIYGGVDVVVPNAGVAHVSAVEDMSVEQFRRVLEVNAVGYLLFMREGVRVLKEQGLGGHVVINASKNVFAPGKDFGAYSASKAAGHQLGKVAAIELAKYGIRVNMINADAVFADDDIRSGLWEDVGPGRAQSRGLKPEELPEYYRKRNLLNVRVRASHIGNAVVFLAGNATPTTGATWPVDGGVVEAFPR